MPLNPMYFQVLSPQQANPFGFGMSQGAQTMGQMLQNATASQQLPYAGQMAQANLATAQQQAPYMQSQTQLNQASLPYVGYKFMAPMLMAQARMAQAGVSNSNAFRNYAQTPQGAAVLQGSPDMANTFQNAMQNSANWINGMPGGIQGNAPPPQNYNNPSSYSVLPGAQPNQQTSQLNTQQINQLRQLAQPGVPDVTQQIQDASGLLAQHKTTDAAARQKSLYTANIEKTLGQIDPNNLTQYAGGLGTAEKYGQTALASMGKESNNYDNYQKSLNAANLLATQVRQFYGDSIQPSMIQRLEGLTDPSEWSNNPKLATALFNQTKQILQMETGTYRQAMQSTAPYQGRNTQQASTNQQSSQPQITASKVLNGTTYHKINGQWYAQ